jgi:hypothetical protein
MTTTPHDPAGSDADLDARARANAGLAELAFGAAPQMPDPRLSRARHLAVLPAHALDFDLADPAQRQFGDYELLEKLGEGGMGVVYRARQRSLDREVAIKLLAAGPWASRAYLERFRLEAQSAGRLNHPNLVPVYEIGQHDEISFYSMRLVRGESLAARLERGSYPTPKAAARLLQTLAEAVDYAHRLGVLHLDLKPANVLLDEHDEPQIADFGLARRVDETLCLEGEEVAGTPAYMAPEQAQLRTHKLSVATDIHGLGAILFELLTGRPPYLADSAHETLKRVIEQDPPAPRSLRRALPPDLDAICRRCLVKDPAQRYASARALAEDLERFIDERAVSVRRLNGPQRTWRWVRREPRMAFALAVLLVSLLGGCTATNWQWQRAEREREAAEARGAEAASQRELALAQSERMQQAMRLMAALFPADGDDALIDVQARAAVAWLKRELPDDDHARGELLGTLADALVASDRRESATRLLIEIHNQLGTEHRALVVDALERRGDAQALRLAVLPAQMLEGDAGKARGSALLARALAAAPADPWLLHVAALYCDRDEPAHCAARDAARRLTEVDPDNGVSWTLAAADPGLDRTQRRELLARAAGASRFHDHYGELMRETLRAFRESGVELPSSLAMPGRVLGSDADERTKAAFVAGMSLPIVPMMPFIELCDPRRSNVDEPGLRADCLAFGHQAADSRGGLIGNAVGWVIVRRLAKGTDAEREMLRRRRSYVWMGEHELFDLTGEVEIERFIDELVRYGEFEAFLRRMDRMNVPRDPPADWVPKDPESLLLPEERKPKT